MYIDALIDVDPYIKQHHIDMSPYRIEILYSRNGYMEFARSQRSEKLIEIYDTRIRELLNSGELKKCLKNGGFHLRLLPRSKKNNSMRYCDADKLFETSKISNT